MDIKEAYERWVSGKGIPDEYATPEGVLELIEYHKKECQKAEIHK